MDLETVDLALKGWKILKKLAYGRLRFTSTVRRDLESLLREFQLKGEGQEHFLHARRLCELLQYVVCYTNIPTSS